MISKITMKTKNLKKSKWILLVLMGVLYGSSIISAKAQCSEIINIPDANFKNLLLNPNHYNPPNPLIDVNNDGEIQCEEAEAITEYRITSSSISDLTGLDAFVNLKNLNISDIRLPKLDLSKNSNLESFRCTNSMLNSIVLGENPNLKKVILYLNNLTEIDLSGLSNITKLSLNNNKISSIDLSKNIRLEELSLRDNQLTSIDVNALVDLQVFDCGLNAINLLDVTKNTKLRHLRNVNCPNLNSVNLSNNLLLESYIAYGCNFTTIDISNNLLVNRISCSQNPNLTCIRVIDEVAAAANPNFLKPPKASWSTIACSDSKEISKILSNSSHMNKLKLYPNPTSGRITLQLNKNLTGIVKWELISITGQVVRKEQVFSSKVEFQLSNIPKGVYIIKVTDNKSQYSKKIVVE